MAYRSKPVALRNLQIKKFADRGWTQARIAERYNISVPRVNQIVNDEASHLITAPLAKRGRPVGSKNRVKVDA